MSAPENNSFFIPEENRPHLEVSLGGEIHDFTWDNTEIIKFTVGEGRYDQVRHFTELNQGYIFLLSELSIEEGLERDLIANDYPLSFRPQPDEATLAAYTASEGITLSPNLFIVPPPEG